tara:strand:- start:337 stop:1095 length:759 start_codon:yes stop_codon:yes gene_type:complete
MAINPYQLANIEIARDEQTRKLASQQKQGQVNVSIHKGKMKREFQDELKTAMDKYKRKSKRGFFGGGFLGKLLSNPFVSTLLLSGLNPLAAGLFSGVKSLGQQQKMRSAAMELPGMERWKNTFLRDPAMEAETTIEDIKDSSKINPLKAITSGLTSYLLSDALGGKTTTTDAAKSVIKDPTKIGKTGLFKGEGTFWDRLLEKLDPKNMEANLAVSEAGGKSEAIKTLIQGLGGKEGGDVDLLELLKQDKAKY